MSKLSFLESVQEQDCAVSLLCGSYPVYPCALLSKCWEFDANCSDLKMAKYLHILGMKEAVW